MLKGSIELTLVDGSKTICVNPAHIAAYHNFGAAAKVYLISRDILVVKESRTEITNEIEKFRRDRGI